VSPVPAIRLHDCNDAPVRASGRYVLYWMTASRRVNFNFALDRALEYCRELDKPLVVFEALRCGYEWASDRLHRFVLDGMADNASTCEKSAVFYYPYVEPTRGAGSGLLEALATDACVVVTDEFPGFFLPRMVATAAKRIVVRMQAVDSNGMLPLRATGQVFPSAYSFRRFLQKTLPAHLSELPDAAPFAGLDLPTTPPLPKAIASRWPVASRELLRGEVEIPLDLPIDHGVGVVAMSGGHSNARGQMKDFFAERFERYNEERNEPELDVASGLSPYLHFGHISAHEVFAEVVRREKWNPAKVALRAKGSREGWWNMSGNAEGFLDELITWREVGYNFAAHGRDFDRFESLPAWALKTLKDHARDEREHRYSLEEFEAAKTFDPLWNAAQTQLVREGRMHNYLRMLWGKKILEWSRSPKEALAILIQLNNKYALDGRDPNSYSGIFWCLGRYDRPWGPERPIFGKVRYMSSENTARKVSVKNYVRKYSRESQAGLGF
jgi:deoxyribodipyrimidine photo-lyase